MLMPAKCCELNQIMSLWTSATALLDMIQNLIKLTEISILGLLITYYHHHLFIPV